MAVVDSGTVFEAESGDDRRGSPMGPKVAAQIRQLASELPTSLGAFESRARQSGWAGWMYTEGLVPIIATIIAAALALPSGSMLALGVVLVYLEAQLVESLHSHSPGVPWCSGGRSLCSPRSR